MQNFEIPDFPPYSTYKPSGVQWLGDIPSHWDVLPHRAIFTEIIDRGHPSEQMLSVTIADGIITQKDLLRDASKKDQSRLDKSKYKLVRPGDIAYNKMRAWQGAIGVSDYTGIVSPAYVVHRAKPGANPRYFHYLLRTPAFAAEAARHSYGIASDMWSLRPEHFKVIYSCVPPLPEQRAIAAYLDRKGDIARRYAIVARRIIATLRELRQIEIQDAVTRGLNEHTPLKPSGVEWLGDIPAHWDTRRLRYVAEMRVSNVDKHVKLNESPVRLCNYVDVYHNERISADLDFMRATATDREIERFRLERGDVIITKDSETWNDIGVPALVEYTADDLICGYHLALLRPYKSVMTGAYLLRALQAPMISAQFHIQANGVTRYGLKQNAIKSVRVPVPPLPEQRAIAAHLDAQTAKIDAAIAHYERMAELVAEYWTVLAADAVTGRIDLRQVASAEDKPS